MNNTTLTQSFALLALNAQTSDRTTVAKRVALRCVAAAALVEISMEHALPLDATLPETLADQLLLPYQQLILREVLTHANNTPSLQTLVALVIKLKDKQLKAIEQEVALSLESHQLLENIPSLISCDMYIHEAGVIYHEYRADWQTYLGLAEQLRAEVLEDGILSDEVVVQLWLLRESGALADFFSEEEFPRVGQRMLENYRNTPLAKNLYLLKLHNNAEFFIKRLLKTKTKLLAKDAGLGINFLLPVLERSQSIFIDVEGIGAKADSRMDSIRERLSLLGHRWEMIHEGRVPLVRIDNIVYECIPDGFTIGHVPIYGVRLRRYPIFL